MAAVINVDTLFNAMDALNGRKPAPSGKCVRCHFHGRSRARMPGFQECIDCHKLCSGKTSDGKYCEKRTLRCDIDGIGTFLCLEHFQKIYKCMPDSISTIDYVKGEGNMVHEVFTPVVVEANVSEEDIVSDDVSDV